MQMFFLITTSNPQTGYTTEPEFRWVDTAQYHLDDLLDPVALQRYGAYRFIQDCRPSTHVLQIGNQLDWTEKICTFVQGPTTYTVELLNLVRSVVYRYDWENGKPVSVKLFDATPDQVLQMFERFKAQYLAGDYEYESEFVTDFAVGNDWRLIDLKFE